ncbi:MAG: mechanosensitive ion channel domain-containing protein [Solirubrobacterales bacterium]
MFEHRTQVWREAGLGAELDARSAAREKGKLVILAALIAGVMVVFGNRHELFPGAGMYVRYATVVALVILGWAMARALAAGIAPSLFRRMDPGTAGTVGFLIRLVSIAIVVVVALRLVGLSAGSLAVGGAFTAVVLGLAAQQTIGNVFAGVVLQSARPFRVGERVRLRGGPMAGEVEGIVGSLGLFYVTLVDGANRMMVPNSLLLQLGIMPLREPERVDLRARFPADTTPGEVQEMISDQVEVPTRYPPHVELEELDREELVVKIVAVPERSSDGSRLASEILAVARSKRSFAQAS